MVAKCQEKLDTGEIDRNHSQDFQNGKAETNIM